MNTTQDIKTLREQMQRDVTEKAEAHDALRTQRDKIDAELATSEEALRSAADELSRFDGVFGQRLIDAGETLTTTPSIKPGRKAQAAKGTGSAKAQTRGKAAAKVEPAPKKAKAAAKPVKAKAAAAAPKPGKKTRGQSRAAEGRRAVANEERPKLKDAIKTVMGNKVMTAQEVFDGLVAKGWTPNAKDPRVYVGHVLSSMSDLFARVPEKGRGYYRVADTSAGSKRPAATSGSKRATAAAAATSGSKRPAGNGSKRQGSNGSKGRSTDEILAEAGIRTLRGASASAPS